MSQLDFSTVTMIRNILVNYGEEWARKDLKFLRKRKDLRNDGVEKYHDPIDGGDIRIIDDWWLFRIRKGADAEIIRGVEI